MWAEAERKKAGCSRWSSWEEGDKYHSAPDSRLVLAPCHYRGLSPMCLLVLCPLLEPERPPLATRPPPQTACSGPFKEGADWTAELEMGPHKESFCLSLLLLGAPSSLSGNPPDFREQFAVLGQRPAASSLPVQLRWLWAQPLWPAFLAACWLALVRGGGRSLVPGLGVQLSVGVLMLMAETSTPAKSVICVFSPNPFLKLLTTSVWYHLRTINITCFK